MGFLSQNQDLYSPADFLTSNLKVSLTGQYLDVRRFDNGFQLFPLRLNRELHKKQLSEDTDRSLLSSMYRAKRRLSSLVTENSFNNPNSLFVTLTYRDNITDFDHSIACLKSFYRKFSYRLFGSYSNLAYVTVHERQKRGAIHFHSLFFNLPFKTNIKALIRSSWSYGFISAKSVDNFGDIGSYMGKYLVKDFKKTGVFNRKSYFISKGLKQPITSTYPTALDSIEQSIDLSPLMVYNKRVEDVGFLGGMDFTRYDLNKHPFGGVFARSLAEQLIV